MNSEDQQSCRSYQKHSRATCIRCTWPWDHAGCRGHHEHACLCCRQSKFHGTATDP